MRIWGFTLVVLTFHNAILDSLTPFLEENMACQSHRPSTRLDFWDHFSIVFRHYYLYMLYDKPCFFSTIFPIRGSLRICDHDRRL
jgi:hypothetical protein